ncbi:hypothetical protein DFQ27_008048 [Actinomortierella ambigua]|uniref:PhoD-like phosphatase domain-containing protein n=1 Tax=Actinomortierella ambigua TaxID=1343610 RepID=A0A9P6QH92_9FUNG|nr:hypothetical protein DFQ27_008048 [Actinomortierella ambigua]
MYNPPNPPPPPPGQNPYGGGGGYPPTNPSAPYHAYPVSSGSFGPGSPATAYPTHSPSFPPAPGAPMYAPPPGMPAPPAPQPPAGYPAPPGSPYPASSAYPGAPPASGPAPMYAPPASVTAQNYPAPASPAISAGPPGSAYPYPATHAPYGAPPPSPYGTAAPGGGGYGAPPGAAAPMYAPPPGMATGYPGQHAVGGLVGAGLGSGSFQCGPLLRYQNLDLRSGSWLGSVLMVSTPSVVDQGAPVLTWSDGGQQHQQSQQKVTGQAIDGYQQSIFWRFSLAIPQDPHVTKRITYSINGGPQYWFFIPGRSESFRWMFYSCNGFSLATDSVAFGGPNPLWDDFLAKHTQRPFHVMIGGGDQLYCDALLNEPILQDWLRIADVDERERVQCRPEWAQCIERYYFNRYCSWFSQGTYGKALAAIPTVNMWDDHDTIDGYGSYRHSTQASPVMRTIGAVSRRFYLLFQHHTTPALAPHHGFFSSGVGENILTSLGPSTSALVLDCRSERTKNMICSASTYDLAFAKLYNEIPVGTRHLLVVLGVPIAYPRLVFMENLMGSIGSALGAVTGAKKVVNRLNGEPELLDDMIDHWTASQHKQERNKFIVRLQHFAADRNIRVTFVSGDVHCAGVGRFTARTEPQEHDPHLMYQLISSAIVNEPPPAGVIRLLHFQDKVHELDGRVKTYEDMFPLFKTDVDGKALELDRLMPRRNYSQGEFNPQTGGIDITLFVENVRGGPEGTPGGDRGTKPYSIHVPRLGN